MMTLTIISITCIFILLTLPIMLFIVVDKLGSNNSFAEDNKTTEDESSSAAFNSSLATALPSSYKWLSFAYLAESFASMDPNCKSVIWAIVNIFMYVNHSINFVLYCLTGSKVT
jgi:ABC-type sulfate transport system permease component